MLVQLPSGAVAAVHEPRLRAVLCGGGSTAALIEAVWEQRMDASLLQIGDADYLAVWCVRNLVFDPETNVLAQLCALYCQPPSARLGIEDAVIAFELDAALTNLLQPPAEEAEEADEDGHVRFMVPDTEGAG